MIKIDRIDHIVLTVKDIEKTIDFYTRILKMELVAIKRKDAVMHGLRFGQQLINLHVVGKERKPNAKNALPGSQDICFITETPISEVIQHLEKQQVEIVFGPVTVPGAIGQMESIYIRDPDGNLIEIAKYQS